MLDVAFLYIFAEFEIKVLLGGCGVSLYKHLLTSNFEIEGEFWNPRFGCSVPLYECLFYIDL